jgi:hypothetical protein
VALRRRRQNHRRQQRRSALCRRHWSPFELGRLSELTEKVNIWTIRPKDVIFHFTLAQEL